MDGFKKRDTELNQQNDWPEFHCEQLKLAELNLAELNLAWLNLAGLNLEE